MKRAVYFVLYISFSSVLFAVDSPAMHLDIYYSASLNGNLDGCECNAHPRSGLVKRAVFLRKIDHSSSLLLDIGDIFDVYPDKLLADAILRSYKELGYDAITIGDQEFSNGTAYLCGKLGEYPFLGNNIRIKTPTGTYIRISKNPLFFMRGGFRIAVLSITDSNIFKFYPASVKRSIIIQKDAEVLQNFIKDPVSKRAAIKILLFHGALEKAREIAKSFPSIDIIIAGHEQQFIAGEYVGDTFIVSPGPDGNMLGHLVVTIYKGKLLLKNDFIPFSFSRDPDDPVIRKRIESYNKTLIKRLNE